MAGVDRPLIAKDTRFRLNFVGARFGLIFFLKRENEMRSNELFHWLNTLFLVEILIMQHKKHKER